MSRLNYWQTRASALLLGLVFVTVAAWQVGSILIAPAYRNVDKPNLDFPVYDARLNSESGAEIAVWYAPADRAEATVILLHPIRSDRRAMLGRARLFHRAGYAVVLIDLQAHGESTGPHITFGYIERHDVSAAVAYARKLNPRHRIGIVAISLGGAAALMASPLPIDALVLESVYTTIEDAAKNRLAMRAGPLSTLLTPLLLWQLKPRLGVSSSELRPIDFMAKIEAPVLIANGDIDRHTPIAQARQLFDTADTPKQWVVFKGAAHNDLLAFNAKHYENEVLPFLDRYLRFRNK
ncbi:alpha/beta hydrolase [Methylotuvimicrobium sp. KM1]|uniref:alpha/beta hydrolase n=1 Tax=Methylotuvimicrobium sp. KM1 TaxID=3377707 RepID=UPI00384F6A98